MELRMKSGRHEYISQFTVAREKLIFKERQRGVAIIFGNLRTARTTFP